MQHTYLQGHPVSTQLKRVIHVFNNQLGVVENLDHDTVCTSTEFDGAIRGLYTGHVCEFHRVSPPPPKTRVRPPQPFVAMVVTPPPAALADSLPRSRAASGRPQRAGGGPAPNLAGSAPKRRAAGQNALAIARSFSASGRRRAH